MHVRYPIWLRRADRPGARVFAFMFALEAITRAMLATIIPLQTYACSKMRGMSAWRLRRLASPG